MEYDALDKAAGEFLRQRHASEIVPSVLLQAAASKHEKQAANYEAKVELMSTPWLDGGRKQLDVMLAEILHSNKLTVDRFIKEATAATTASDKQNASSPTKAAKGGGMTRLNFRKQVRALFAQRELQTQRELRMSDTDIDALFPKLEKGDSVEADLGEMSATFELLEQTRSSHEAVVATASALASASRQKALQVTATYKKTHRAERAVANHEAAQRKLNRLSTQLGASLNCNGDEAAEVAGVMAAEGPVGRVGFRLGCETHVDLSGWADKAVYTLFKSLCSRLGRSEAEELNRSELESALRSMQEEAETTRDAMRSCNIEVIETSKAMRTVQDEYKKQVTLWEQEAAREATQMEQAEQAHAEAARKLKRSRTQKLVAATTAVVAATALARSP